MDDLFVIENIIETKRSNNKLVTLFKKYIDASISEENLAEYFHYLPTIKEKQLIILKENDLEKLYYEIELPLVKVLRQIEEAGVLLDVDRLNDLSKDIEQKLNILQTDIFTLAGEEFNLNSPKQLQVILFEKLQIQPVKKTKTGFSTNVEVLETLAKRGEEIALHLISYRKFSKLKQTYVDALPKLVDENGRIHTTYNQFGTVTGRLSSQDPNLQNIPIRDEYGRKIRECFIASPGCKIMAADYSQIELRILAHIAEDANMIKAFKNDEDIHAFTAALVNEKKINEVTAEERRKAKATNFGIVYGISAFGLAKQLDIGTKEAQTFIDNYFAKYPQILKYIENTIKSAQENWFVKTLFGRKRYIPEINSHNKMIFETAKREVINMPIQGTAADLIKIAMLKVQENLTKKKINSRIILQIHDELVLEVEENELEKVEKIIQEEMSQVITLSVPLKVDLEIGDNWSEAH